MRLFLLGLLLFATWCCVGPRSTTTVVPAICRFEVLRTPSGCSVVERTWRLASNGLAELDDSSEQSVPVGSNGVACSSSVLCTDVPIATRPECSRPAKTAAFFWDGGGCRFSIGAPTWGVCEIRSYCSRTGGLSEGVLYVPEGFAGRVGPEILWCGC